MEPLTLQLVRETLGEAYPLLGTIKAAAIILAEIYSGSDYDPFKEDPALRMLPFMQTADIMECLAILESEGQ